MIRPAFDAVALDYDERFTERRLGRLLRGAVWRHLAVAFRPGEHVLELGCGTGEDAVMLARRGIRVHATDAAPAMLETAREKAHRQGMAGMISFGRLDLGDVAAAPAPERPYDGAFSDFGVLNNLPDLGPLAGVLARWIRPGGRLVLVVMGPLCPWEWGWYGMRGHPRTALRRLLPRTVARLDGDARVPVWYPSPRALRRAFASQFRPVVTAGIGVLLPPSFASDTVERWPRLFDVLARAEAAVGTVFPGTWLNDHYLVVLERTDARALAETTRP